MTNQNSDLESRTSDGWTKKEHRTTVIASIALTGLFLIGVDYLTKQDVKRAQEMTRLELKAGGYSDKSIENFIKEGRRFAFQIAQNLEEFKSRHGEDKTGIDYELYLERADSMARKVLWEGLYRDEKGRLYWAPLKKKGLQ
jgi:hypothetical protein